MNVSLEALPVNVGEKGGGVSDSRPFLNKQLTVVICKRLEGEM